MSDTYKVPFGTQTEDHITHAVEVELTLPATGRQSRTASLEELRPLDDIDAQKEIGMGVMNALQTGSLLICVPVVWWLAARQAGEPERFTAINSQFSVGVINNSDLELHAIVSDRTDTEAVAEEDPH